MRKEEKEDLKLELPGDLFLSRADPWSLLLPRTQPFLPPSHVMSCLNAVLAGRCPVYRPRCGQLGPPPSGDDFCSFGARAGWAGRIPAVPVGNFELAQHAILRLVLMMKVSM